MYDSRNGYGGIGIATWRVNILALIGALIGIMAIFVGWVGVSFLQLNLIDLINLFGVDTFGIPISSFFPTLLLFVILICLICPLISLLTPVGGMIGMIGAIIFVVGYIVNIESIPSSIGPYLLIVSGIICTIGIFKPIGLNYTHPIDLKGKLLTFSTLKIAEPPIEQSETPT